MHPRIDLARSETANKLTGPMLTANKNLEDTNLPPTTMELVKIRASQINGCARCLEIHTSAATKLGMPAEKLHLLAGWRDATVFSEPERAALEMTEAGTRLADAGGIPDDVWAHAAKHYDDEQMTALVAQIALINAFNRVNIMTQQPNVNR